jgi:hypothetical protein
LATCSDIHFATCSFKAFSRLQYSAEYSVVEFEGLESPAAFVAGKDFSLICGAEEEGEAAAALDPKENPVETTLLLLVVGGGFDGEPNAKPEPGLFVLAEDAFPPPKDNDPFVSLESEDEVAPNEKPPPPAASAVDFFSSPPPVPNVKFDVGVDPA